MSGAEAGRTKTQDQESGAIPVAIRWLSPEGCAAVPLGLQPVTIGRKKSKVIIDDEFLSAPHAEIRHADGVFVVEDLKSKNGTFVNGARTRHAVLRVGDIVRMGDAVGLVVARMPSETQLSQAGAADREQRLAAFRATWGISPSEAATLAKVVLGVPNKIAADELGCSIANVEAHMTALLRAARVGNRTALVAKFWSTPVGS